MGRTNNSSETFAIKLDDTSTANVTYIGKANVGEASSAPRWQIQRMDETSGIVITWAGSGEFNQIWDNRVSLTYT